MNLFTMIKDIGPDADLLTRHDAWLEQERRIKATKLDEVASELRAILLAQKIKTHLQQSNLAPIQQILRDENGEVVNIIVRILNLPDAIALIRDQHDTLDEVNAAAQITGWELDGYDVKTCAALRD